MAELMCAETRCVHSRTLEAIVHDRTNTTWASKSLHGRLGSAGTRVDCCSSDAHGADSLQSLRRPRVTRETRCTFLLWCASSSSRRSSQCYRVREIPLRLRVDRVEQVTAKSHSRDALWRYSGQCWPIADGLDRLKLREGPMYPTSWPPREQRRLNSAFLHCDNARTAKKSATRGTTPIM